MELDDVDQAQIVEDPPVQVKPEVARDEVEEMREQLAEAHAWIKEKTELQDRLLAKEEENALLRAKVLEIEYEAGSFEMLQTSHATNATLVKRIDQLEADLDRIEQAKAKETKEYAEEIAALTTKLKDQEVILTEKDEKIAKMDQTIKDQEWKIND